MFPAKFLASFSAVSGVGSYSMQTNSTVDLIFKSFPRFASSTGVIGC